MMTTGRAVPLLLAFIFGIAIGFLAKELIEAVRVDGCLDRGGAWDYQFDACNF